jgi:drug/metabolite transporter (DMT)-like permease
MTPSIFYGGLISALCAAAVSLTGTGLATRPTDIALCVMLGVVQLGIGNFLFALASRYVPAAELTLYSLGEPVLSPLWTYLGVGETPSLATLAGGSVILVALILQASDAWRGKADER